MKKYLLLIVAVLTLSIGLYPVTSEAAIADGTHNLSFQVNKPDSSSASMANDYFLKPAKLIVSNGSMKIQMTIKNSSWVTEFNPPGGHTVISSNPAADQRVVQFNVSNLNTLKVYMKIDIDDIDYHHGYTVDFVFNSNGLPEKPVEEEKPDTSANAGNNNANNNTSNNTTSNNAQKPNNSGQNASSESQSSSSNTSSEEVVNNEEESAEEEVSEATEEEPNPDTSDAFPYIALLLLLGSIFLLVRFKNIKL